MEAALALPEDDRARLAEKLIASLDGDVDQNVETAWVEEIERRLAKIEAGQSTAIAMDESVTRLRRSRVANESQLVGLMARSLSRFLTLGARQLTTVSPCCCHQSRRGVSTPNSLHVASTGNVLRAMIGVHARRRRSVRVQRVAAAPAGRALVAHCGIVCDVTARAAALPATQRRYQVL